MASGGFEAFRDFLLDAVARMPELAAFAPAADWDSVLFLMPQAGELHLVKLASDLLEDPAARDHFARERAAAETVAYEAHYAALVLPTLVHEIAAGELVPDAGPQETVTLWLCAPDRVEIWRAPVERTSHVQPRLGEWKLTGSEGQRGSFLGLLRESVQPTLTPD